MRLRNCAFEYEKKNVTFYFYERRKKWTKNFLNLTYVAPGMCHVQVLYLVPLTAFRAKCCYHFVD